MAQPLNERAADCAKTTAEHLADFGDTKKQRSRRRNRAHEAAAAKSVAPYLNVVRTGPDASEERHRVAPVGRPDPYWRPHNESVMTMDKALREMEFPSRLAGAEWVLE